MISDFSINDEIFMRRALELAAFATGRTSPNPLVGCVITHNDQVLGEGYHHQAGTPHAEIHALIAAGDQAKGATVYVSLEPCSHFGKTPPCTEALLKAGVSRVVVAMPDPNPIVAGRGIKRLRECGIQVDVGLLAKEAALLNEVFVKAITTGLPFVVYKSAQTLDGKISTVTGDSRWISNPQSREFVHQLRNQYDVIMVGSNTVQADNPELNCRLADGRDPVRLIVDGKLSIADNAHVLTSSASAPCIIATTFAASKSKVTMLNNLPGVEVWQYSVNRYVPLELLMRDLIKRGWTGVLLEGGSKLAGIMIQANLVDKIDFFIAPKLIGGNGPSPLSGLNITQMAEAIQLNNVQVDMGTGDIHISGYL
ncbi:MAG: bifunctional diaminohydroxyphosphoribosylaminopyrimidine deaminase/5-amino-6-(5-phosphoribosylamino)uracil reductase RibD [Desulfitobacteriaceae bacterium]